MASLHIAVPGLGVCVQTCVFIYCTHDAKIRQRFIDFLKKELSIYYKKKIYIFKWSEPEEIFHTSINNNKGERYTSFSISFTCIIITCQKHALEQWAMFQSECPCRIDSYVTAHQEKRYIIPLY